jgi:hypothetical protein
MRTRGVIMDGNPNSQTAIIRCLRRLDRTSNPARVRTRPFGHGRNSWGKKMHAKLDPRRFVSIDETSVFTNIMRHDDRGTRAERPACNVAQIIGRLRPSSLLRYDHHSALAAGWGEERCTAQSLPHRPDLNPIAVLFRIQGDRPQTASVRSRDLLNVTGACLKDTQSRQPRL